MSKHLLILAGTPEARALALQINKKRFRDIDCGLIKITSSFAGLAKRTQDPPGCIREGGFGGPAGFRNFLIQQRVDVVINAVHPFAEQMSRTASDVCAAIDIPLLRLRRPKWLPQPDDDWQEFDDLKDAIDHLPAGARALMTTGRNWQALASRSDIEGVIRLIHPPTPSERNTLPAHLSVLTARPPFTLDAETKLLQDQSITHLIAKNAGGQSGLSKLVAARNLSCPVFLLRQPVEPAKNCAANVNDAMKWIASLLS